MAVFVVFIQFAPLFALQAYKLFKEERAVGTSVQRESWMSDAGYESAVRANRLQHSADRQ